MDILKWVVLPTAILCFIALNSMWIALGVINHRVMETRGFFPPLKSRQIITLRVDSSFSLEEQKSILRAMEAWEKATDGLARFQAYVAKPKLSEFFSGRDHYDPMIYDARKPWRWIFYVSRYMMGPPTPRAMILLPAGDIFIMLTRGDKDFQSTVEHELGHMLIGGWHSPNQESVMFPWGTRDIPQRITTANALLAKRMVSTNSWIVGPKKE